MYGNVIPHTSHPDRIRCVWNHLQIVFTKKHRTVPVYRRNEYILICAHFSFALCNFVEPGHSTSSSSSTSVLVLTQLTKSVSLLLLVLDVIVKHEEILPWLLSKNSLFLFSESSGYHCLGVAGVWWGVCISAWPLIINTKVLRVLGAVASGGSPLHFFPIILSYFLWLWSAVETG